MNTDFVWFSQTCINSSCERNLFKGMRSLRRTTSGKRDCDCHHNDHITWLWPCTWL